MATLGTGALTMLDLAKGMDPDGKVARVIELLAQTNEMINEFPVMEGNLPTGHRTTIRTGLPTVYWRLLNQGVAGSKSTKAQVTENAGILEAWSEVDVDLAKLHRDVGAFRLSEAKAFIEAMNQEMQSTVLYGNAGLAPEEFTGLSARYSTLTSTVPTSENTFSAGGSGSDNTSIWLCAWGEETGHGIYPQGSEAGLVHSDYGEVTVETSTGVGGSRLRAFQERFQWKLGLVIKDWRYFARTCNIDISTTIASTGTELIDYMERMDEVIPNELGNRVFYVNRTISRLLRQQVRRGVSAGGGLTYENFAGKRVLTFGGVPIRKVDALLNTESVVS